MKKQLPKLLLLLTLTTSLFQSFGQNIEVKGKVIDKKDASSVPGATVMLLHPKDSTFYKFSSSKSDGTFLIKGAEEGDYLLQISFIGYASYFKPLTLSANQNPLDIGSINISAKKEVLKTVEVVEEMVPVIINGDTVEYNADAFKTQPEANVGDLLKKLPGVEVDKDGTVKAQGEEVKKVLIDGKEFFGDDTKLATENLPADMVKKVQIYDDFSETSKITGIDDGDRTKTINLKVKKDRKKGLFGNVTVGGGATANATGNIDDERELYNGKFNINKFKEGMQLSTLGMLNNVNKQGFSYRDYINFSGGAGNAFRGGRNSNNNTGVPLGGNNNEGFTKTTAGGINLNYDLTKSINLSSSYFYNQSEKDILSTTERQYIADRDNFNSNQTDWEDQFSGNHIMNLKYKQKIDSTQDLTVKGNVSYAEGDNLSNTDNINTSPEGAFLSSSNSSNKSDGNNLDFNGSLVYGKRFKKKGRSLVTNLSIGNTVNEKQYNIENANTFFDSLTSSNYTSSIVQSQNENNDQLNYSGKISVTEPIGKRKYLELNYKRSNYNNNYQKEFYDIPTPGTEIFNQGLSLDYDNSFVYDNYGVSAKINSDKSNITVGASAQRSDLDGKIASTNFSLRRVQWNILPRVKWNYRFSKSTRLNFNYRSNVQEPSLEQLQPSLDNSNPLNLYQGNPDLKTEYSHRATIRLMSFNQFSFTNVFAMVNAVYTENKITNSQTLDSRFVQTTTPVNVDNDFFLNSYLYFGSPIRPIKAKVNIGVNSSFFRNIVFVNTKENIVKRFNNGIDFSIENRKKDVVDAKIGTKFNLNKTSYSQDDNLDQDYLSTEYYAELLIELSKTWTISTDVEYTTYSSNQFNNNPAIPIWKAYISKRFLKGNSGLLKLSIYDILNKNVGINRTSEANYIQDQRITTLSRYIMLSFTYKIRRFGGKKKKSR